MTSSCSSDDDAGSTGSPSSDEDLLEVSESQSEDEEEEEEEEGPCTSHGQVVAQKPAPVNKQPSCKRPMTVKAMRTCPPAARPRPSTAEVAAAEGDVPGSEGVEDLEARRQANIAALLSNSLETKRAPLMSRYLSLQQSDLVLKRAFVSPVPGAPPVSEVLKRKLVARRRHVPWGSSTPWAPPALFTKPAVPPPVLEAPPVVILPPPAPPAPVPQEEALPEGIEPLVLWAPPEGTAPSSSSTSGDDGDGDGKVLVDNMLVRWLRPHQREGVAFMFECVTGLRFEAGRGCILADDMGLGKTLQALTLLWTLTQSGHELLGGRPLAQRSLIVCPTSLVGNWANEAVKWLKGRLSVLALCEASRDDVTSGIARFLHPSNPYKVLILSYETFRIHSELFKNPGSCDLLICDEAHRLKNDATLTNRALDSLPCQRRVLLSGTPMQNHLEEFFAMVDFCNPGVLGTPGEFRRRFESPILASREPGASPEVLAAGEAQSLALSNLVNAFILRRTNTLLSAHLPPKVVMIVCCKLTPLQQSLYCHFLESKAARKILGGKGSSAVLPAISNLKKLCNHPKLIYDTVHSRVAAEAVNKKGSKAATAAAGFENVASLFPPCLYDDGRPGRGVMAHGWETTSGKFAVAARLLEVLWKETDDKIVLVSNYTQTLDLFAVLCRERGYPMLRLDGSTSVNKREKLVQAFNDVSQQNFAFLLSSKAGGCGLNLVGANRLLLFDVDWNPAVDKQAAARVWRDGQKRRVYVYRFLATGTIEEKVFQRQISKEGLQALVSSKGGGSAGKNMMSAEELRELFALHPHTLSHTYEVVQREARLRAAEAQQADGSQAEEDEVAEGEEQGMQGVVDLTGDQTQLVGAAGEAGETAAAAAGEAGGDAGSVVCKAQDGSPATEEELAAWGHHSQPDSVPDLVMQRVAGQDVSFVFSCQVAGKHVEEVVFQPRSKPGLPARVGRTVGAKRTSQQMAASKPVHPPASAAGPHGSAGGHTSGATASKLPKLQGRSMLPDHKVPRPAGVQGQVLQPIENTGHGVLGGAGAARQVVILDDEDDNELRG